MKTMRNFFTSASVILFISLAIGHESQAKCLGVTSKSGAVSHTISARLLSSNEIQSINTHSTEWIELRADGEMANSRFRLLAADGSTVEKGTFKNGTCRLDVSGVSSGKYQIEVFTGDEWVYQTIVLL
ncbi:MAG TPA: hypothetical protein PK509_07730 [Catalimonadaceae bacterium]|nr:hypothetical protein [Catalimonadaceae bacterium]